MCVLGGVCVTLFAVINVYANTSAEMELMADGGQTIRLNANLSAHKILFSHYLPKECERGRIKLSSMRATVTFAATAWAWHMTLKAE